MADYNGTDEDDIIDASELSPNITNIYPGEGNDTVKNATSNHTIVSGPGEDTISAYKKAYPKAKDENYIKKKTNVLLNKEEIRTMVKEEIKKILADEGISPEWIVGKYKDIAELSDRDTDKLRSLEALAKMSGLFDTEKKQEQLTVFQGFTQEQMEALSGKGETKLIAHKEKDEE